MQSRAVCVAAPVAAAAPVACRLDTLGSGTGSSDSGPRAPPCCWSRSETPWGVDGRTPRTAAQSCRRRCAAHMPCRRPRCCSCAPGLPRLVAEPVQGCRPHWSTTCRPYRRSLHSAPASARHCTIPGMPRTSSRSLSVVSTLSASPHRKWSIRRTGLRCNGLGGGTNARRA